MARIVKQLEDAAWYVPDLGDNRADTDPFRVLIMPLSGADMLRLETQAAGAVTAGARNAARVANKLRERIIRERVERVEGYQVRNPKTGRAFEPKNGAELVQAVGMAGGTEPDLVLEDILAALRDHSRLEDGLPERLTSRCEPSSAGIARSPAGGVDGADERNGRAPTSPKSDVVGSEIATA